MDEDYQIVLKVAFTTTTTNNNKAACLTFQIKGSQAIFHQGGPALAQQNTDAVQLMVTPRHPNLHVCAAAWGGNKQARVTIGFIRTI